MTRIMIKSFFVVTIVVLTTFIVGINTTLAHPGNTASDGCHYCRTNCDRWGEAYGERHCHNAPAPAPAPAARVEQQVAKPKFYSEFEYKYVTSEVDRLKKENESFKKDADEIKSLKSSLSEIQKENKAFKSGEEYINLRSENKALTDEVNDGDELWYLVGGGGLMYAWGILKRRRESSREGKYLKGNITRDGEKVLYSPNDKYYSNVRVDEDRGEMWFKNAEEAEQSGWRNNN